MGSAELEGGGGGRTRDNRGQGHGHQTAVSLFSIEATGECLPGAHPAHARRATFLCVKYPTLAPSLSPPREVPQVDRTTPQTFRAKHVAYAEI